MKIDFAIEKYYNMVTNLHRVCHKSVEVDPMRRTEAIFLVLIMTIYAAETDLLDGELENGGLQESETTGDVWALTNTDLAA